MFLALLVALGVPAAALARSSWIYSFELQVAPRGDGSAHFWMRTVWDPFADGRLAGGVKYVGLAKPESVVAHDADGRPLDVFVSRDKSRPGWAIHYSLGAPRRDPAGTLQEAVIEFDQALDTRITGYAWGGAMVTIPWARDVDATPLHSYYVVASDVPAAGEFTCANTDSRFFCERAMNAPEPFEFVLKAPSVATWIQDVGTVALAFALSCVLIGATLRRQRRRAIRERGVVPDTPAPSQKQDGYRAPPPRPEPVLADADRRALQRNAFVAAGGLAAAFVPTLFMARAPIPMGIFSGAIILASALVLVALLQTKRLR